MKKTEKVSILISIFSLCVAIFALSHSFHLSSKKPILKIERIQVVGSVYSIRIRNTGNLPLNELKIVLYSDRNRISLDEIKPSFKPPSPYKYELIDKQINITLERQIAANDAIELQLKIYNNQRSINGWIYANNGESDQFLILPPPPCCS